MDNEKKLIILSDKEGENKYQINSEKGEMTVLAAKKLTIKVGDDIELVMTGSNGTVELKSKDFKINLENSMEVSANKQFRAEASTVKLDGNSAVKISGGPVSIEGLPIKVG